MPKESYIPSLLTLFRQYGYDGATLSKISQATGLGKASLYHHFPGGKDDMVESVLCYSASWLQENVLSHLMAAGTPEERLQKMCDRLDELYAGGTEPCLLAILQSGTGSDLRHSQIQATLTAWIEAIATVLKEAGWDDAIARQRSEDALITIQGAVMVSFTLDDPAIFQRKMQSLPQAVLRQP
ncbi:MAG: TetR/AcrR family transcriptional regulator [Cyanobacteria bacterium P01_A01_bin.70]